MPVFCVFYVVVVGVFWVNLLLVGLGGFVVGWFVTLRMVRVSKAAVMLSDRWVMAAARRSTAWKTGAKVSWIQWVVGGIGDGWWLACWLSGIVIGSGFQEAGLFAALSKVSGRTGSSKKL